MLSRCMLATKVLSCVDRKALANLNWARKCTGYNNLEVEKRVKKFENGPSLNDFILSSKSRSSESNPVDLIADDVPYINDKRCFDGRGRKVYFDVYGCQMNVNDTEIVWSILQKQGYAKTADLAQADVILVMTCAIRDSAEQKIWNRLDHLKCFKRRRQAIQNSNSTPLKIGILGCMAERLKHQLIEKEEMVDLVAGPDSYRHLPAMLAITEDNETAVNVMLSLDETYADIMPVRLNPNSPTAYLSIMRGCDNMCSYCIVPFTRGRERSRPMDSILDQIRVLSDQGVKEVILLGQNVNSYRCTQSEDNQEPTTLSEGFRTIYKPKKGGIRFATLLQKAAEINPEMRIRFTSPHPKDFPDDVLYAIRDYPNICSSLHLPAQCGSTRILESMRRGYSREAYLNLVTHVRNILPDVALSSDFIAGFCGETDAEFDETLTLMREVKYHVAYLFAYSMREKTHAHRKLVDDVPKEVKLERLNRMIEVFREEAEKLNSEFVGQKQLVLVEGVSKRSVHDLAGRNDANIKVIFPKTKLTDGSNGASGRDIKIGDYVLCQITGSNSQVLKGQPLFHTTLTEFSGRSSTHLLNRKIGEQLNVSV